MIEMKKHMVCHVDKVVYTIEAGKRAEFMYRADVVEIVDSILEGWEEIKLVKADQLRFGIRKEGKGQWLQSSWRGVIEPYKALPTEAGLAYNKCPGWENAPWGYDLLLPVGEWDKIKIEIDESKISGDGRRLNMSYFSGDLPKKVMLLERKLK